MKKVVVSDSLNNETVAFAVSVIVVDDNFDSVSQVGSSVGLFF